MIGRNREIVENVSLPNRPSVVILHESSGGGVDRREKPQGIPVSEPSQAGARRGSVDSFRGSHGEVSLQGRQSLSHADRRVFLSIVTGPGALSHHHNGGGEDQDDGEDAQRHRKLEHGIAMARPRPRVNRHLVHPKVDRSDNGAFPFPVALDSGRPTTRLQLGLRPNGLVWRYPPTA